MATADQTDDSLTPVLVDPAGDEFRAVAGWPFEDVFVSRMLADDIPVRAKLGNFLAWLYRDADGQTVGFGTLQVCDIYSQFTGGASHTYIPLLAKNPAVRRGGVGTFIVGHLVAEAQRVARDVPGCHWSLFLDVYTASAAAIHVYSKSGFVQISPGAYSDELEGGKEYLVMARRVF